MAAIDALKGNKALGPDGFTPEFYQTFKFCLAPRLFRVFASTFEFKKVPLSWQEASVVLIPKEGCDLLKIFSVIQTSFTIKC